jgi:uncharacterized protein (DUF362 family)
MKESMPDVYWSKTDKRVDFVRKVLGIFEPEITRAHTFLVKPNLVSSEPYPTTTHPVVLGAVLEFLSGKDVVVADAPAVDAGSSKKIVENSALKGACDSYGIPFTNLYGTKTKKSTSPRGYRFHIFTLPLQKDFVISLPVLKTHNQCQMTGALKNQFGYLPRRERILMHLPIKNIHKGIAELNVVAKPHLFIIDAVQTFTSAQEARHGGIMGDLGYMLAGTDPVALDCFGLRLLEQVESKLGRKSPEDIPHLKYSLEYRVGSREFRAEEIKV